MLFHLLYCLFTKQIVLVFVVIIAIILITIIITTTTTNFPLLQGLFPAFGVYHFLEIRM
jgi:hypothetical protein